jgi:hypothetical protein
MATSWRRAWIENFKASNRLPFVMGLLALLATAMSIPGLLLSDWPPIFWVMTGVGTLLGVLLLVLYFRLRDQD